MDRNQTKFAVFRAFEEASKSPDLVIDLDTIRETSRFVEDLGFDSLDFMEVQMQIEDETGLDAAFFTDLYDALADETVKSALFEEQYKGVTVADMIDYIAQNAPEA